MGQAVPRYKQHKKEGKPYDPQADGFVSSLTQIEREVAKIDRRFPGAPGNRTADFRGPGRFSV